MVDVLEETDKHMEAKYVKRIDYRDITQDVPEPDRAGEVQVSAETDIRAAKILHCSQPGTVLPK